MSVIRICQNSNMNQLDVMIGFEKQISFKHVEHQIHVLMIHVLMIHVLMIHVLMIHVTV